MRSFSTFLKTPLTRPFERERMVLVEVLTECGYPLTFEQITIKGERVYLSISPAVKLKLQPELERVLERVRVETGTKLTALL